MTQNAKMQKTQMSLFLQKNRNIKIIIAGMIAPTSYGSEYKESFDKIFFNLSKEYNLQLIPFLLEGVAQKPEFNLSDGMHPNDKGTIVISKTLKKATYSKLAIISHISIDAKELKI